MSPYEALCRCAESLRGAKAGSGAYDDCYLAEDRATLLAARAHLGPTCAVSLSDSLDDVLSTYQLLPLARAIRAEARQWHAEARRLEATEAGLDVLRLANVMRRGGLLADMLLSYSVECMGFNVLRVLRVLWTESECEGVLAALATIIDERENYSDIVRRDREWEGRNLPRCPSPTIEQRLEEWKVNFGANDECAFLLETFTPGAVLQQRYHLEKRGIAMTRLLCCEAAISIEREQGGSLDAVPVHRLPCYFLAVDPFSSQPFVFRKCEDGRHVLYSVGPTGIDHHGHFGSWTEVENGTADLCLDYASYETD